VIKKSFGKGEEQINCVPIYSLFSEMILSGDYNVESETMRYMNYERMEDLTEDFISNIINKGLDEIKSNYSEYVPNLFKGIQLNKENFQSDLLCTSLLDLTLNFQNICLTKINGKMYYRISYESIPGLVIEGEENNQICYLLKTKNEKISLLLYENSETNSGLSNYFLDEENSKADCSINDYLNQIYKEMGTLTSKKKNIFIPKIEEKEIKCYTEPKTLDEFTVETEDGKKYKIKNYEQLNNFLLGKSNEEESNNENESIIEFEKTNEEEDILIKNDFLITVINTDLLNEFELPCIASFIFRNKKE
ncbi:MAG: hypothetical protein MJ252_10185, partial [archaeon]|nr:hypothetical protein [archaeon]